MRSSLEDRSMGTGGGGVVVAVVAIGFYVYNIYIYYTIYIVIYYYILKYSIKYITIILFKLTIKSYSEWKLKMRPGLHYIILVPDHRQKN
jgi:hypothetical protein